MCHNCAQSHALRVYYRHTSRYFRAVWNWWRWRNWLRHCVRYKPEGMGEAPKRSKKFCFTIQSLMVIYTKWCDIKQACIFPNFIFVCACFVLPSQRTSNYISREHWKTIWSVCNRQGVFPLWGKNWNLECNSDERPPLKGLVNCPSARSHDAFAHSLQCDGSSSISGKRKWIPSPVLLLSAKCEIRTVLCLFLKR